MQNDGLASALASKKQLVEVGLGSHDLLSSVPMYRSTRACEYVSLKEQRSLQKTSLEMLEAWAIASSLVRSLVMPADVAVLTCMALSLTQTQQDLEVQLSEELLTLKAGTCGLQICLPYCSASVKGREEQLEELALQLCALDPTWSFRFLHSDERSFSKLSLRHARSSKAPCGSVQVAFGGRCRANAWPTARRRIP